MGKKSPLAVERELFARVVFAWLKDGRKNSGPRGRLASTLETFTVRHDTFAILKNPNDVDLVDEDAWVLGRPIKPHHPIIFPVISAAMRAEEERIVGTVRVALLYEGTDRLVDFTGWRFESAETREVDPDAGGKPKPHTYPHAQPCSSWKPRRLCLIHPDAEPESQQVVGCPDCFLENDAEAPSRPQIPSHLRPAFPLRCRTLPGLAVAAIAAIYGANITREILDRDTLLDSCGPEYASDFRHILGEPDPEGAA